LAGDQDHPGVGTIEPIEHRSSPLQQIFWQTTPSLASHSPDAQHDWPRLNLVVLGAGCRQTFQCERSAEIKCGTQPKVIQLQMHEVDLRTDKRPGGAEFHQRIRRSRRDAQEATARPTRVRHIDPVPRNTAFGPGKKGPDV